MTKPYVQADVEAELAELKRKSEELIAQAAEINQRLEALAKRAQQSLGNCTDQASITDTWTGR